ncbi:MAG: zinc-dependent metalloprotease [Solirubrobacterales bacterium]|nr:zinc-dependent metalloprotease [Solirubrobacterales bacterium]
MIDWIIANRIATFVAGTGEASPPKADLTALAAEAETRVVAYTGLTPARPIPPPEGITRKEWVATNLDSMRLLLDPVLQRAGDNLGPLKPAMEIGMGIVLSTEIGVVVGYLGQRVLGQYELVLLDEAVEDRPPRLLFVLPNLGQAVQAFGAEEEQFMTWVTLHEVTHAVQFAGVPWLHAHMGGLVRELLKSAEVRLDAPRKLRVPSTDEVKRVLGHLRNGDLISIVTTTPERETLDRVQSVMAVVEGHAEHVMDAVAPDLLPSLPKLRAALDRRRKSQSGLSRLVARLLGLELKLRQYEQGKFFCDAIVRERGPEALRHLWSGPEVLPTLAELRDPQAWLDRTMPRELDPAQHSEPDAAA